MNKAREIRLRYTDTFGRQIYVDAHTYVDDDGRKHVVFEDMTHEHKGMSITNSVEYAIPSYERTVDPHTYAYYETYDFKEFDRVSLKEGSPQWERVALNIEK